MQYDVSAEGQDQSYVRLQRVLYRAFRALAKVALRHGFSAREANNLLKKAYVDVARESYGVDGRPTNKARVATLTGLTRVDVAKLIDADKPGNKGGASRHPLNRLIMYWLRVAPWSDGKGNAQILSLEEGQDSFKALVSNSGGDIAWQTLLKELLRLQIAEQHGDKVTLLKTVFVPAGSESESLPFLGEDVPALIGTMNFNLQASPEDRLYQRKVVFPGLTEEGLQLLQRRASENGQLLLELLDEELRPHVLPPGTQRSGISGLGIFAFNENSLDGEQ